MIALNLLKVCLRDTLLPKNFYTRRNFASMHLHKLLTAAVWSACELRCFLVAA